MNYWKISNLSNRSAKLIVSLSQNQSKGLLLQPGEFCVARNTQTPVMDAQIRRNLVEVDKSFDNEKYKLEVGKVYSITYLNQLVEEENDRMKQAKIDAENYVKNQE